MIRESIHSLATQVEKNITLDPKCILLDILTDNCVYCNPKIKDLSIINGKCVCEPQNLKYFNLMTYTCLAKCPDGYKLKPEFMTCVPSCLIEFDGNYNKTYFDLNGTCVKECPKGYMVQYELYKPLISDLVCVKEY